MNCDLHDAVGQGKSFKSRKSSESSSCRLFSERGQKTAGETFFRPQ